MRKKALWAMQIGLLLLSLLGAFLLYNSFSSQYLNTLRGELLIKTNLVQDRLALVAQNGPVDWKQEAQTAAQLTGCRVTLLDGEGKRLADSLLEEGRFYSFAHDTEVLFAKQGQVAHSTMVDPITDVETMFLAKPAIDVGGTQVIVRLAYPLEGYAHFRRKVLSLAGCALVAEFVLLALLYNLVGTSGPPWLKLLLPFGDSQLSDQQEIQILREQIARLEQQMKAMRATSNKRNSNISSLIASMEDGLLAVDLQNNITLITPRAEQLIATDKAVFFRRGEPSEPLNSVAAQILEWTALMLKTREEYTYSLKNPDGLDLQVKILPMYNKYQPYDFIGANVTIKDVTKVLRLENLRREFVANVSHELRTPLTAIAGFTEMLRTDGELTEEERQTALNCMEIEVDRLRRLISELLTLSSIENELAHPPTTEKIEVAPLVEQCYQSLLPLAQSKDITMTLQIDHPLTPVIGNREWLQRVVVNLCENAVKYTLKGGRVEISAKDEDNHLLFQVKDNGPGIPKEDLPRIFERFYRVDKARNRKIGGSGLGLAIVHHIVQEMGGVVDVESEERVGSTFTVRLPNQKAKGNSDLLEE